MYNFLIRRIIYLNIPKHKIEICIWLLLHEVVSTVNIVPFRIASINIRSQVLYRRAVLKSFLCLQENTCSGVLLSVKMDSIVCVFERSQGVRRFVTYWLTFINPLTPGVQLQVCLSMYDLLVDTRRYSVKMYMAGLISRWHIWHWYVWNWKR